MLTQYGFLPAPTYGARHVIPLKEKGLGRVLDGACFSPLTDDSAASAGRRWASKSLFPTRPTYSHPVSE